MRLTWVFLTCHSHACKVQNIISTAHLECVLGQEQLVVIVRAPLRVLYRLIRWSIIFHLQFSNWRQRRLPVPRFVSGRVCNCIRVMLLSSDLFNYRYVKYLFCCCLQRYFVPTWASLVFVGGVSPFDLDRLSLVGPISLNDLKL